MCLVACGPKPPTVPAELLTPPVGYTGSTPKTEGQFKSAVIADRRAFTQCVLQLESISNILAPPP